MEEKTKMTHEEMASLVRYVTHELKEGLPKNGCSLMFTSDGQGGIYCHAIGSENSIFKVLSHALSQNEALFKLICISVAAVQIEKDIRNEVDERLEEFLEKVKSHNDGKDDSKDEKSSDEAGSKADPATDSAADNDNE